MRVIAKSNRLQWVKDGYISFKMSREESGSNKNMETFTINKYINVSQKIQFVEEIKDEKVQEDKAQKGLTEEM